jgi:hypothetical protein
MKEFRKRAEAYRLALTAHLIEPAEVIAWAKEATGPAGATDPALVALAKSDGHSTTELVELLGQVRGTCDTQALIRDLFGAMHRALRSDPAKAAQMTQILERLAHAGFAPDSAAEVRMWAFEELRQMAESGSLGTPEVVHEELENFLKTYAPFGDT